MLIEEASGEAALGLATNVGEKFFGKHSGFKSNFQAKKKSSENCSCVLYIIT